MAAEATLTFKTNYDTLRSIAEKMRTQQEPDIDTLVEQVDISLNAYRICKDRLDTVKKMLDERFGADEPPG